MLAARGHPDAGYMPPPQAVQGVNRDNAGSTQAAGGAAGLITSRVGPLANALTTSRTAGPFSNSSSALSQIPTSNSATIEYILQLPTTNSLAPSLSTLVSSRDEDGNTALHHASTAGNLKAVRALILAGADPFAKNMAGWTPEAYSVSVQAEVYFKGLINEWKERHTAMQQRRATETALGRQGPPSPDRLRQGSEDLPQTNRPRRREGPYGNVPGQSRSSPSVPSANVSGMGKGGLRLVMPDDDDEQDQRESDIIRSQNPYQTLVRSQANNRRRGLSDNSYGSSATSGSGSTELSSGSSASRSQSDADSEPLEEQDESDNEELSDSESDATETVRNSAVYDPQTPMNEHVPGGAPSFPAYLTQSPGRMMASPQLGRAGLERETINRRGLIPGVRTEGDMATPSVETLPSNDVWK